MAISRNQNVVDGGLGQPSAGVRPVLALFGSEHKPEFTRPLRFERVGFARSFGSDDLAVYDNWRGFGVAVCLWLHFGGGDP